MNKPKIIMMIGLPASGKSTKAEELAKTYNANIHASDKIREELGDINNQDNNQLVFQILHNRIKDDLKNDKNCIYDATNINYKRRKGFLEELNNIPCEKICIVMATPYRECIKNNHSRERQVPIDVIKRMYKNFHIPYWYEGWDDIQIEYSEGAMGKNGYPVRWLQDMKFYDQENSHHTFTLGEHCEKAWIYVCKKLKDEPLEDSLPLKIASILHDCGKVQTKSFYNSKGELGENAHYYNHQYVGAYESLFFNTLDFPIDHAILIMWHMQLYFIEGNEKALNKYKKLWGEKLYNDIMLLHEADVNAH
jgi:predicted kinase